MTNSDIKGGRSYLLTANGAVVHVTVITLLNIVLPPKSDQLAPVALTRMTFSPGCSAIPLMFHSAVPVAVPLPPLLLAHSTFVTAVVASLVVPDKSKVVALVEYVSSFVGIVNEREGVKAVRNVPRF